MYVDAFEWPRLLNVISNRFRLLKSSSLTRHRRTHEGFRPYVCPTSGCGRSFTRRTTLMKHIPLHLAGDLALRADTLSNANSSPGPVSAPEMNIPPNFGYQVSPESVAPSVGGDLLYRGNAPGDVTDMRNFNYNRPLSVPQSFPTHPGSLSMTIPSMPSFAQSPQRRSSTLGSPVNTLPSINMNSSFGGLRYPPANYYSASLGRPSQAIQQHMHLPKAFVFENQKPQNHYSGTAYPELPSSNTFSDQPRQFPTYYSEVYPDRNGPTFNLTDPWRGRGHLQASPASPLEADPYCSLPPFNMQSNRQEPPSPLPQYPSYHPQSMPPMHGNPAQQQSQQYYYQQPPSQFDPQYRAQPFNDS